MKRSTLPGAGKGLFTKVFVAKGTRIVEYKGRAYTWAEVEKLPGHRNSYIFYFTRNYVIDAWKTKKSVAHFANDARGLVSVPGIRNNSDYVTEGKRCFIEAVRNIPAGSEIFVDYGREYWQAVRYNIREDERKKRGKKAIHHRLAKRTKSQKLLI